MNIEQLEKGKKLKSEIERVEGQVSKWEEAKGVNMIFLSKSEDGRTEDFRNVLRTPINFHILKTLALADLNHELEGLKEEFQNL